MYPTSIPSSMGDLNDWVVKNKDGVSVYQKRLSNSEQHQVNANMVVIQVNNLSVEVPATCFDEIAIAWCKNRNLNTNKYTLEELLANSEFQWPVVDAELCEKMEELIEDIDLKALVKAREHQPAIEANLELDNIFDVVTSEPADAESMRQQSNVVIQLREAGRALSQSYPILSKITNEGEHTEALAIMELLIEDYDSNLLLIDALSCAITRYENQDD